MQDENNFCDPVTGECSPTALKDEKSMPDLRKDGAIIYVGDPMCSWCYGISPELKKLKEHFAEHKFSIVVGGLRPGGGGGEAWDDHFKSFLMHHWQEVNQRSGQPFGYELFDRVSFHYDTEPPCRAVVASRRWVQGNELSFFEAVSRKFYFENQDPGEESFYQSICEQFNIPFESFLEVFRSEKTKYDTHQEFLLNRNWGVSGYPTVLFKLGNQLYQINHGYTKFDQMKKVVENIRTGNEQAAQ